MASSTSLPFDPAFDSASGLATLSGVAGASILQASATSVSGSRVNTTSSGLQEYTYSGSLEATRTFSGTLTYSQTLIGEPYPQGIAGGIIAVIELFTLPSGFDAGDTVVSNFLAMADPSTQPGFASLGSIVFNDPNISVQGGTANFGVSVTLQPGESVFAWAFMQTPVANGSEIDAFNTFVTHWDDPTNLVPAAVAVPEPATLALLGLGVAGLRFSRRKQ